MTEVRSYGQLLKELQKARDAALKDTGDEVAEIVKKEVDNAVYNSYTPEDTSEGYKRTGELRESIESGDVESSGDVANIEIKHNTSKIGSYSPNQHMSMVDGKSSAKSVPEIVHDGKSGKIFGEGAWTQKRPYMDNAKQEVKKGKYKDSMKKNLKKQGFTVK